MLILGRLFYTFYYWVDQTIKKRNLAYIIFAIYSISNAFINSNYLLHWLTLIEEYLFSFIDQYIIYKTITHLNTLISSKPYSCILHLLLSSRSNTSKINVCSPASFHDIDSRRSNSILVLLIIYDQLPFVVPYPRESQISVVSLKVRCPKPLDNRGIRAKLPSYYFECVYQLQ